MSPGMPITSVRCNGRFAFAEFRSAEETTNAMNLNGIIIVGQSLNVGRPSAYTGPATQHVRWEQLMAERIAKHPELKDTAIGMPGPGGAMGGPQAPAGGAGPDPSTKICRELYIGNMPEGVNEGKLVSDGPHTTTHHTTRANQEWESELDHSLTPCHVPL